MRFEQLNSMTRGWFVGDFSPAAVTSEAAEVAIQTYVAGDIEQCHVHRESVEVTVVVMGEVHMASRYCPTGSVIVLEPGEHSRFEALTDAVCAVVKIPSRPGDKFVCEGHS